MLDSLKFSVNAVLPIFLMVVVGFVLKKIGLIDMTFVKKTNKIVFVLFIPVLLFYNIYKLDNLSEIRYGYVIYSAVALVALMLIGLPLCILFSKRNDRRGVLLQAIFRSNYALVGIPLAGALFGASGEITASLLSVISVPMLNIIAVIALTVFSGNGKRPSIGGILLGIIKNPLIVGVFAGILTLAVRALFVECDVSFRLTDITPLIKVIEYLAGLATPLALISLGAQFEFSEVGGMRRELIFGIIARTVMVPLLTLSVAYIFFRDILIGAEYASLVALFATPVAVSTVPMTQEMGGDSALAGQLVVWTTALSSVSIFLSAFVFRLLGVF